MLLAKDKDLGKPPKMLFFILIPLTCFLDDKGLSFFRSVLLSFSRHHPVLDLLISFYLHLLLPLIVDIEDVECIRYQIFLDVSIEGSVGCEAGSIVNFEEVGVELMIDHDVKAQDLEAHIVGEVVWMH